jgi:hypothetical protein
LAAYDDVIDGTVYRVEHSYPIYDADYADHLQRIKVYLSRYSNLQTIGRNGLHRYNNQDHAMLTGIYAVRNVLLGTKTDLWQVNAEQEYLEELLVEDTIISEKVIEVVQQSMERVFPKLDAPALGLSIGLVAGLLVWVLSLLVFMQSDPTLKNLLELLNQFFPGYSVTLYGALIGFFYGFLFGFAVGWLFAFLRNVATAFYFSVIYRSAEENLRRQFFELL